MPRKRGRKKKNKPEYTGETVRPRATGETRIKVDKEILDLESMNREQRVQYEVQIREDNKSKEAEDHLAKIKSVKLTEGERQFTKLEALSYERYTSFIKSHEEIVVVVYEVPTSRLTTTDQIDNWRLGLTTALQKAGNMRKLQVAHRNMHFEATSKGSGITLIKGYFRVRDATGSGADQHRREAPPAGRAGLIIE